LHKEKGREGRQDDEGNEEKRSVEEKEMWTHTRIRIGEGAVREGHRLEGDGRAIA
jgi:hypothetical protein